MHEFLAQDLGRQHYRDLLAERRSALYTKRSTQGICERLTNMASRVQRVVREIATRDVAFSKRL